MAQVSWADCVVFLLGDNNKPSGQGPGQQALGGPACPGDWAG